MKNNLVNFVYCHSSGPTADHLMLRLKTVILLSVLFILATCHACAELNSTLGASDSVNITSHISLSLKGGTFVQINRQTSSSSSSMPYHHLVLSQETLTTEIEISVRSCHSEMLSFELPLKIKNLKVVARGYRHSPASTVPESPESSEVIVREGEVYLPVTPQLDLSVESDEEESHQLWLLLNGSEKLALSTTPFTIENIQVDRDTLCGIAFDTASPNQTANPLIVRIQLSYEMPQQMMIGVITQVDRPAKLDQALQQLKQLGVHAVIVLGPVSQNGSREQLYAVRKQLKDSDLFWWILPGKQDVASGQRNWADVFGNLNFACDLGRVRLIFLHLLSQTLADHQLTYLDRWRDHTPLNDSHRITPHTLMLISQQPLINFREDYLDTNTQLNLLRTFNLLRAANTTHSVISHLSYQGQDELTSLGVKLLRVNDPQVNLLQLTIDQDCKLGEVSCINWAYLSPP